MFVRGIVDGKIAALERVLSREPVDGLGTSDQPRNPAKSITVE